MADALTATAAGYARDDDPELVRAGAPATLKMIEMMLDTQPTHPGLLITACSGFTQYAYAFLQIDSEILGGADTRAGQDLRERAGRMYARARGYCLRALGTSHKALAEGLVRAPQVALALLESTDRPDVPALFWSAAAWAGYLALSPDQLVRLPEVAIVRALFDRALLLDEGWQNGTIHEAMIAIEGLPRLAGGSPARARRHFDQAVALSGGQSAFAYVTLASSVSLPANDRSEFERLLQQALAIDSSRRPELRLANLVAQKRARFLLASAERLFRKVE